jgi:hypothetical protein
MWNHFEVGALAGGGGEARCQLLDGGQAGERFGVGAFIDDVDDFVDETVEADERGQLGDELGGIEEALGALFAELIRVDHKHLCGDMGLS